MLIDIIGLNYLQNREQLGHGCGFTTTELEIVGDLALPRPTGTAPQSESLWRCIRDVLRAALWLVSGFEGGRTAAI